MTVWSRSTFQIQQSGFIQTIFCFLLLLQLIQHWMVYNSSFSHVYALSPMNFWKRILRKASCGRLTRAAQHFRYFPETTGVWCLCAVVWSLWNSYSMSVFLQNDIGTPRSFSAGTRFDWVVKVLCFHTALCQTNQTFWTMSHGDNDCSSVLVMHQ